MNIQGAENNYESSVEEKEESNNKIESDSTCFFNAYGGKFWTSKFDDKDKPQINQYFSNLKQGIRPRLWIYCTKVDKEN